MHACEGPQGTREGQWVPPQGLSSAERVNRMLRLLEPNIFGRHLGDSPGDVRTRESSYLQLESLFPPLTLLSEVHVWAFDTDMVTTLSSEANGEL